MEADANKSRLTSALFTSDGALLASLALARILLQVLTNGQYGFHQDELVTLDAAAHHLAWGYVAWPPVTPFLARLSLTLFGPSLIGLRSFAVVAEGMVMLLTGLMVRDLGGRRWAQVLGAVAVATTPNSIIQGGLFQYETFDYLCWVLLAFTVIRLCKSENPRWWLGIGAAIGLGMITKYTIAFSVVGVIVGILVTRNRRYLTTLWPWAGALLSLVIWLPNVLWQVQNHWISLDFLASIHTRDVQAGLASNFLVQQIEFKWKPTSPDAGRSGLSHRFSGAFPGLHVHGPPLPLPSTSRMMRLPITGPSTCATICVSPGPISGTISSISASCHGQAEAREAERNCLQAYTGLPKSSDNSCVTRARCQ